MLLLLSINVVIGKRMEYLKIWLLFAEERDKSVTDYLGSSVSLGIKTKEFIF